MPGPLLVVLAAACWGTGGLAGSVLGEESGLSPTAVGTYRLALAALALLAAAALGRRLPGLARTVRSLTDRPTDALRVVGVGVGLAVFQVFYFLAVAAVGVSVATLVTLGLAPLLVTLGAALLLGERVGTRLRVALPLALVGLALLVGLLDGLGPARGGDGGGDTVLGAVLACVSATGYAGVTLLGRSLSSRVASRDVTTLGFVIGAVVALPVGSGVGMAFDPAPTAVALAVYLGLVPTALAYGLFFAGLRTTASGTASVLTLVEPLTATVLAVLLLGERLGPWQWLGAGLLCAAVVVLSVAARSRPVRSGVAGGAETRTARRLGAPGGGHLGSPP